MPKVTINRLKTITNDPRTPVRGNARMLLNVDVETNPYLIKPRPSTESGDISASARKMENYAIAKWTDGEYKLFSLGVQTGAADAKIFFKAFDTLTTDVWSVPSNGEQGTGTTFKYDLFTYYERTKSVYFVRDGQYVSAYNTNTNTMTDSDKDLTSVTNLAEGLVHSKDDILYVPYDNKIIKNNNGSWSASADITLPEEYYITSICEYGNYIAIAGTPLNGYGKCRVWLWDRDATLTTLSESIDFGEGVLRILEEVDGFLVGLSLTENLGDKFTVRAWSGGSSAKEVFILDGSSIELPKSKQKVRGRLRFLMRGTFNGTDRSGLWSIGRGEGGIWTLYNEQKVINDTAIQATVGSSLISFISLGLYNFISYLDSSSNNAVSKTKDSATNYTATTLIETAINPEMVKSDRSKNKQLKAVRLHYEALPTAGTMKLSYRVDNGSWVEIFTDSVDNSVFKESTKDVNKSNFKEGREYEFKIESVGSQGIIELTYEYDIKSSQL